MIQRIQTVFLFMIIVLMVAFQFFPVWENIIQEGVEVYRLYPAFYYTMLPGANPAETVSYWPYALTGILAALTVIVSVIEIFSYKNRMNQIKLGALNSLLMGGSLILAIYFTSNIQEGWEIENPGQYGMAVFFPAISLICNMLANRFIRKDERLVKSMDRIR